VHNEANLLDVFQKKGFEIVDVLDPLDRILEALSSAKIVVSMEGSHFSHCLFSLPDRSGILILQPADRFGANQRHWAECLGVAVGFVVGEVATDGYKFSTNEILKTIDLLLAKMESTE
jgi:capsular polysaccharide biosynthesis protein